MNECISKYFFINKYFESRTKFNFKELIKGKAFYEVIRVINGKCLFIEDHLERLRKSLQLSNFPLNPGVVEIMALLHEFLTNLKITEGNIKLILHFKKEKPDIYIYQIKHKYPDTDHYKNGIELSLLSKNRPNPTIKYIDFNLRSIIDKELKNKGVYEVLLVDENNYITEGSKSNVFFIKGNKVYTAPESLVLPGITRFHVIKICKQLNLQIEEKPININKLSNFNSIFITGTSPKVLPVKNISTYHYDVENENLRRIMNSYNELINDYLTA